MCIYFRHYTLVGLLNKLCIEVYGLQAIELTQTNSIDTQSLKTVQLDQEWYASQVKERLVAPLKNSFRFLVQFL